MAAAIDAILKKARPKDKSLLHTRIFYSDSDMILQYKSHILPILEAHSGAMFHEKHPILKWLPRHAAFMLSRVKIGEDGKTSIRNIRKAEMDKLKKMKKAIGEDAFKDAENTIHTMLVKGG